jgi:hypothetical protein
MIDEQTSLKKGKQAKAKIGVLFICLVVYFFFFLIHLIYFIP